MIKQLQVIDLIQLAAEIEDALDDNHPAKEKVRKLQRNLTKITLMDTQSVEAIITNLDTYLKSKSDIVGYYWCVSNYNMDFFNTEPDTNLKLGIASYLNKKWPDYTVWANMAGNI